MSMYRWFEHLFDPFAPGPRERPPTNLRAFYWHYVRQIWPVFAWMMVAGFIAALIEVSLFAFLGKIVDLVREAKDPASFFFQHGRLLVVMALVAVVARPVIFALDVLLKNQGITPGFTALIRWQTHRYVLRQSLDYFQSDFAGRIANKIMQTGMALRESVMQLIDALWFVSIYTISALVLFAQSDPRLMVPLLVWLVGFYLALAYFVPKIKQQAILFSEGRSMLTGRIVDSYTNIMTVKLFAHTAHEDDYAREAVDEMTQQLQKMMRLVTTMEITVMTINGVLVAGTCGLALWLWSGGLITIGAIALTVGLVIRINNMSQWIMWVVTSIFENIGMVEDGMQTIAQPHGLTDRKNAPELKVTDGQISFEKVHFNYGKKTGGIEAFSLDIAPGEKVGLVGRSGAGKSTLVNLLLRFYDLRDGCILIDGQDIATVAQDSLRAQIGMVSQDTSLLHRSVLENIRYGNQTANRADVIAAARQAHADEFVVGLRDLEGRQGYEAHVGDRGVKLSGGQRQRIAIARVLLKNAPILILDEATSALDSEVEAAIQEQLYNLMRDKTVIAIAHRLSTIAAMDRLVIIDQGRIVEIGDHDSLIRQDGLYAHLWAHQSGGFLPEDLKPEELRDCGVSPRLVE